MGSKLKQFFVDKEFPVRSFYRIFIFLSFVTYIIGRLIDPGPSWLRNLINFLIYRFNLDLIHQISLLNTPTTNLWYGSGFALQVQLLFVCPISWIFAVWSSCVSKYESKEYLQLYRKMDLSDYGWKQLIIGVLMLSIPIAIAYFPFQGDKVIEHASSVWQFSQNEYISA